MADKLFTLSATDFQPLEAPAVHCPSPSTAMAQHLCNPPIDTASCSVSPRRRRRDESPLTAGVAPPPPPPAVLLSDALLCPGVNPPDTVGFNDGLCGGVNAWIAVYLEMTSVSGRVDFLEIRIDQTGTIPAEFQMFNALPGAGFGVPLGTFVNREIDGDIVRYNFVDAEFSTATLVLVFPVPAFPAEVLIRYDTDPPLFDFFAPCVDPNWLGGGGVAPIRACAYGEAF